MSGRVASEEERVKRERGSEELELELELELEEVVEEKAEVGG